MKHIKEMLKNKSHIIWDWNGTLLNDVHLCADIVAEIAARYGAPKVTRESYLKKFRFPVVEYYKELGFDLEKISYEDLSKEFIESYQARIHLTHLHVGMAEFIADLADWGIPSSILSAAHEKDLHRMLKRFKIDHLFTHIFGIHDHLAHGKIQRGQDLIEALKLPLRDIILIGDTDHDAEVAETLGIDGIILDGGHQCHEKLRQKNLKVISRKAPL